MYVCTFVIFGTKCPQLIARVYFEQIWLECFIYNANFFSAPLCFVEVMPTVHQSISCSLAASTDLSQRRIRSCTWVPRSDKDCFFCWFPPLSHQGDPCLHLSIHCSTLPSLSILDILQAVLRRNVNALTLTWLKIHEPTRAVAAPVHFQWIAPWFQEFSLPDVTKMSESNELRLTLDWTYPTRPSSWKWYCELDRRPTARQPSASYSVWLPFKERQWLNFQLYGLCWIWGFANPESNLSSGTLVTNQVCV